MNPLVTGSLISAGSDLLGGLLGKKSADKGLSAQNELFARNVELQREFAQNGIRWRVEDAKRAGVHPLFALGGSGASYTPQAMSLDYGNSIGDALSSAGQNIGRAVSSTLTADERMYDQERKRLELQRMRNENALLEAQYMNSINKLNTAQAGPTLPSAASPDTGQAVIVPAEVKASNPAQPEFEAGPARSSTLWARVGEKVMPFPSQDVLPEQEISNPLYLAWLAETYDNYDRWTRPIPPASELKRFPKRDGQYPVSWEWTGAGYRPLYADAYRARPRPNPLPRRRMMRPDQHPTPAWMRKGIY